MSLILDALNRADQERSEEKNTLSLQRSHSPQATASSSVQRWTIEALIILLVLAVLIYTQWVREVPATAEQPAIAVDTINSATTTIPTLKNSTADLIELDRSSSTDDVQTSPATVTAKVDNASIKTLYQNQQLAPNKNIATEKTVAAVVKPVVKPIVKPVTKPAVKKAAPADITRQVLQQIPLLSEFSTRFQQSVPNIDYSVHVYSEKSGGGFVNLNGSMRKIGAELAPGLRVVAILKDSVVLEYGGYQFRLMALNSWINFN